MILGTHGIVHFAWGSFWRLETGFPTVASLLVALGVFLSKRPASYLGRYPGHERYGVIIYHHMCLAKVMKG